MMLLIEADKDAGTFYFADSRFDSATRFFELYASDGGFVGIVRKADDADAEFDGGADVAPEVLAEMLTLAGVAQPHITAAE